MKILNFRSFEDLERSGFLPKLVSLYIETFEEWGEEHDFNYLQQRVRRELSLGGQKPFCSIWIDEEEVLGGCWGAVLSLSELAERLEGQRPTAEAQPHFSQEELEGLVGALQQTGFSSSQGIQFWDEILIAKGSRGKGLGPIIELVRFGATRLPLNAPTLMWTVPSLSLWHKIAKRVWGAKVVFQVGEVEFLLVYPTWKHKIVMWLRLDRTRFFGQLVRKRRKT